jgi:hypothetical protein
MIRAEFKLTSQVQAYSKKVMAAITNEVNRSALMVQREAVQLLNESGKSSPAKSGLNQGSLAARKARPATLGMTRRSMKSQGLYWYGEPLHRWVEASQPGTPPHKQTGTLQRSIAVEVDAAKTQAKIGPSKKLVYARKLELGGDGTAPRPYLLPAFQNMQDKILRNFEKAIGGVK